MILLNVEFPKTNGRLAFFDYDWTLVTHNYSKDYFKAFADGYFRDCYYMLTALEEEHKGDKPLPCMQWYVKKLFDEGCEIYVLTHERFNLRDELKKAMLKKFYPDVPMGYLTVDSPDHKIDMMRAVAMTEGYEMSDVIFVDDRMETVNMAKGAGIDAKYLADVVVMYENSMDFQEQGTELKPKRFMKLPEENTSVISEAIINEGLEDVFQECRRLAEMNGRSRDGGTQL